MTGPIAASGGPGAPSSGVAAPSSPERAPEGNAGGAENIGREQEDYIAAVADRLSSFLDGKRALLAAVSPDAVQLAAALEHLVTGGKRLRALMCYWGWRGAGGAAGADAVVTAGAALELFQAAALIHDDIIDRSDTRRGQPSVHRRFEGLHDTNNWTLDRHRFGEAAGILAGDLCLSFSEELFSSVGGLLPERAGIQVPGEPRPEQLARNVFNTMRTEVMAGQYLDILEEVAGPTRDPAGAVDRARTILRYKSAKYSMEHPLVLGGALAGGSPALLQGYAAFGLPLGEAFQLRDDVLGVFGDPETTGKPAGDDLREGKRTVLIGYTLSSATAADALFVDRRLGHPDLSSQDIDTIRAILARSGALKATEALIDSYWSSAFAALEALALPELAAQALHALAITAVRRSA
ncbi:MAG: geranylgeranyl pyrophosphate synthase [Micrococcaceae bacterium]|nr:geranylgeranyl pyrophosphate synthase [Micrococcaceae bacterium]